MLLFDVWNLFWYQIQGQGIVHTILNSRCWARKPSCIPLLHSSHAT